MDHGEDDRNRRPDFWRYVPGKGKGRMTEETRRQLDPEPEPPDDGPGESSTPDAVIAGNAANLLALEIVREQRDERHKRARPVILAYERVQAAIQADVAEGYAYNGSHAAKGFGGAAGDYRETYENVGMLYDPEAVCAPVRPNSAIPDDEGVEPAIVDLHPLNPELDEPPGAE